jgi:hypothetical protein
MPGWRSASYLVPRTFPQFAGEQAAGRRRDRPSGLLQNLARGVGHSQAPARCLGQCLPRQIEPGNPLAPPVWSTYTRAHPLRRCRRASSEGDLVHSRLALMAGTRTSSAVILIHGQTSSGSVHSRDGERWLGERSAMDSRRYSSMGGARGSPAVRRLRAQNQRPADPV